MINKIIKTIREAAFYIEPKNKDILYVNVESKGNLENGLKRVIEPTETQLNNKLNQLQNGRNYLMNVEPEAITVEDALEAFGFGRNGHN